MFLFFILINEWVWTQRASHHGSFTSISSESTSLLSAKRQTWALQRQTTRDPRPVPSQTLPLEHCRKGRWLITINRTVKASEARHKDTAPPETHVKEGPVARRTSPLRSAGVLAGPRRCSRGSVSQGQMANGPRRFDQRGGSWQQVVEPSPAQPSLSEH